MLWAIPVDFSLPVDPSTSDWIALELSGENKYQGIEWFGDNIYPFFASGKNARRVFVKETTPMDPGLFLRIDTRFIRKGHDINGNSVPQVWFVIEAFQNDPSMDSSPDIQITYDSVTSKNDQAKNGLISLDSSGGWKSYVALMPSPYFNKRYEPFTGRIRDISIVPLTFLGSWFAVRRIVIFKKFPLNLLTLNVDNPYPSIGDTVVLTARVIDGNGDPVAGRKVDFSVVSGKARLVSPWAYTDSQGIANVTLIVDGWLPVEVTAHVESPPAESISEKIGEWHFSGSSEGWQMKTGFSYDSGYGHSGAGSLKFSYHPTLLWSWEDDNSTYISNPQFFSWDSSFGYSGSSIKFINPSEDPPPSEDPDSDGNSTELLVNPDFSGDNSWYYDSSKFSYDSSENFPDSPSGTGSMKSLITSGGADFQSRIELPSEGIGSSSVPFWIRVSAWIKMEPGATGNAYIDLYNQGGLDTENSPTPPADGQWHQVVIYERITDWSSQVDPDGSWGTGDELVVRGVRDWGTFTGAAWWDKFEVEIGYDNNPNPSFEYPVSSELKVGKGGWRWHWDSGNLYYERNNITFTRMTSGYGAITSAVDGNAYLLAMPKSGASATYADLSDEVPYVEPGAWYRLSGWIFRSSDYDANSYIDLYADGLGDVGPDLFVGSADAGKWTYVEGYWQAPSDWDNSAYTLLVRCVIDGDPSSGYVGFDNVRLEKINVHSAVEDVVDTVSLNAGSRVLLKGMIFRNLYTDSNSYIDLYLNATCDGPDAHSSSLSAWREAEVSWDIPADGNYKIRLVTDTNTEPPVGSIWYDELKLYKRDLFDSAANITVSIEPGATYRISGWIYRSVNFTGYSYIDIQGEAADPELGFNDLHSLENGKWVYVEGFWTNTYGLTSIRVRCVVDGAPEGEVWFDDVKIEKVKEVTEGITDDKVVITPTYMAFSGPTPASFVSGISELGGLSEFGASIFQEGISVEGPPTVLLHEDFSDLSSWTTSTPSSFSHDSPDVFGGPSGSLKVSPAESAQNIHTTSSFTFQAGKYYKISVYARGELNSGFCYVDLQDIQDDPNLHLSSSVDWAYYFKYWRCPVTDSKPVRVVADANPSGTLWVDELTVQELNLNYTNWGMGISTLSDRSVIKTGVDPSNPLSHTLKIDVEDDFVETGGDVFCVVEYSGGPPLVEYKMAGSASMASGSLLYEVEREDFVYRVFKLSNVNFTGSFYGDSDILISDQGNTTYIAGVWVSRTSQIFPSIVSLKNSPEGVVVTLSESGSYLIERRLEGTDLWERVALFAGKEFVDTTVRNGSTYEYRVAWVFGSKIVSPYSETLSITAEGKMEEGDVRIARRILSVGEDVAVELYVPHDAKAYLKVLSLSGIEVYEKRLPRSGYLSVKIPTGRWTAGVYMLEVGFRTETGDRRSRFEVVLLGK